VATIISTAVSSERLNSKSPFFQILYYTLLIEKHTMAITEFVWLTANASTFISEFKQVCTDILNTQDRWFAETFPELPHGKKNRALAVFQQIEHPEIYLLTAHWESIEQHTQWQSSKEFASISGKLVGHVNSEKTALLYLEGAVFAPPPSSATISLLQSPVVSIGRCLVATEHRTDFSRSRESIKGLLDDFAEPHLVRDTWKAETPGGEQEFVFLCGWPTVEKHMEFAKTDAFPTYLEAHQKLTKGLDVKHYRRVL
jgi:hypothetical protein